VIGRTTARGRERVLIVGCCRTARIIEALAHVRAAAPDAHVTVLVADNRIVELASTGVDAVATFHSSRLGPLREPRLTRRLRNAQFDTVVVPYMVPDDAAHANVLRLAAAIAAAQTLVLRGSSAAACSRRAIWRLAALSTLWRVIRLLDVPVLLIALGIACILPRPRRQSRTGAARVLHIISGIGAGGAQRQLGQLLKNLPGDQFEADVLVLAQYEGEFSRTMLPPTVRVRFVTAWPSMMRSMVDVYAQCRRERYDIVHTWLFSANVVGAAAARLARTPRVVASVRNMSLWKARWYWKPWFRMADSLASHAADVVTVNAEALVDDHARWAHYPTSRIAVIPNGVVPIAQPPSRGAARAHLLATIGGDANDVIIGTVGRLAPEKDHATFLRIVTHVRGAVPAIRAVIVGAGHAEPALRALATRLGIADIVHWAGERPDATAMMAGFDLLLLTSLCEGMPNVLLEAGLLGVPCVSTRVGGAGEVLGEASTLFAPGNDIEGAAGVMACLARPQWAAARAERTRQHIADRFTVARMVDGWIGAYGYQRSTAAERNLQEAAA
jgi:glycosyltransferase involved in cell wall biosynthesis